jgi:hypothetical protein
MTQVMVIRKLVLTMALAAAMLPSLTFARGEHQATVLLRNGDRVSGLLEDVEGGVVYVRVSLHDQRRLGLGEVALIDFVGGASGLPETELSVARGANHVALLRNGSSLQGQFVDIRGGEASASPGEEHQLYFRLANGEERHIPLNGVSRIYLGNFPAGTNAANSGSSSTFSEGGALPAGAIRVPANQTWVPTSIRVRRGDQLSFNATGRIQLSDNPEDVAQAAGSLQQRRAAGSPLPANFAGALIARVGNSAPFPIGDNTAPVTMPAAGQLYLGINDDEVSDNRGEFMVTVVQGTRR